METFGQVLAAIIGPVIGILVGIFYIGTRNAKTKAKTVKEMEAMLDDVSYIQEMKHLHGNDEKMLITKYVETLIRRTFGTKDAMKLAKPIPKE